jgi:hypothetical protein
MSACEIREPIRHVTRPEQIATLRYYRRLRLSSRDLPIWRRSNPADEVLSPAQNRVIGRGYDALVAEVRISSARKSMHKIEYSFTLSRHPGTHWPLFFW